MGIMPGYSGFLVQAATGVEESNCRTSHQATWTCSNNKCMQSNNSAMDPTWHSTDSVPGWLVHRHDKGELWQHMDYNRKHFHHSLPALA